MKNLTRFGVFDPSKKKNLRSPLFSEGHKNRKAAPADVGDGFSLFYLDSNQDKQDQNLLCCHYTIEQNYGKSRKQ